MTAGVVPDEARPEATAPLGTTRPAAGARSSRWSVLSAGLVMGALAIDVGGTRWGSYLGVAPVFLPDALLLVGALLAAARLRLASRVALASSVVLAAFAALQLLRPGLGPAVLVVRDLAPLGYLALVPLLAVALRDVRPRTFLRVVRCATAFLAATLAAGMAGVLRPLELPLAGVPVFLPRPDADLTVLAVGVVAFGAWEGIARPYRLVQVVMVLLAAAGYSRAGLLAVMVCVAIAIWRERYTLTLPAARTAAALVVACLSLALLSLAVAGLHRSPVAPPQAVERLLTESDTSSGTTGARVSAWSLVARYTVDRQQVTTGEGPGTSPIGDSGAVRYLSGDPSVRAAHSWPLTAVAYFGVIGLLLWSGSVVLFLLAARGAPLQGLVAGTVAAYLTSGLLGVIIESPFGSLPLSVMLAWGLAHGRLRTI